MDRLGTQARQAPRAEPAAARRERYDIRADRGAAARVPPGVRYVITLDSDTRLPRETVRQAGRQDGAPAQPAALRRHYCDGSSKATGSCSRASRPRCRPAAKARCSSASSPASSGIDPYASARLGRVPGSVWRRLLHRQGHLRRRCLRSRARRPRAGNPRCSATICSRACSPAPVWSPTSRWSRTSPPYDVAARASTAGRAATGSCCRGYFGRALVAGMASETRNHAGDRPLEDARQSATNAVRSFMHAVVACGIYVAVRCRVGVDRLRPVDDPAAGPHPLSSAPSCHTVPGSRCAAISARLAPICASRSPSLRSRSPCWRIRRG